jgi:hypothetical protein
VKSSYISKKNTLLLVLIVVISCAVKKEAIQNDAEITFQPKLLFLNYEISKTDNGAKKIELISQKITEGKLKKTTKKNYETRLGDLECITLDKNLNQIGSYAVKNPLKKIMEYINDLGNFEKKIFELDSAQFSIRLQLQSDVKYIRIYELTKTGLKEHITTELE